MESQNHKMIIYYFFNLSSKFIIDGNDDDIYNDRCKNSDNINDNNN